MWAPKLPGEGAALFDAARAMRDAMIALGVAVDGGKDSLSMATKVGAETVKSPRELVVSVYAAVPDILKTVTPDIKRPGQSVFLHRPRGRVNRSAAARWRRRGSVGASRPTWTPGAEGAFETVHVS
jgi:phosphoribosylformylglycinamidine synthase